MLVLVLSLSELIYLAFLRLNAVNGLRPVMTFLGLMGSLFVLYAAGCVLVLKLSEDRPRLTLGVVLAGAVLFRLTLLPAGLPRDATARELFAGLAADVRGEAVSYERFQLFDDDVWRYLWDGHVWAHGVNPYVNAPDDSALDELSEEDSSRLTDGRSVWGAIRANVAYASLPTVYPPLAQAAFRLSHALAPGSLLVMKSLMAGFDLLAVLFLVWALAGRGRPAVWVELYAWNPLVIKVFAGSGHVDAILAATLAATAYFLMRRAPGRAAVSFGLAVLAKITPLVLFPFFLKRVGWRYSALAAGVILAGYTPFLAAGRVVFKGLWVFANLWQFNAGPFTLFEWLSAALGARSATPARILSALLVLGFIGWLTRRDDGRNDTFAASAAAALGALIVFSPTVMPWYVAGLLPLAVLGRQRVWIYFSGLVCLAFLVMVDQKEHSTTLGVEYGVFALLLFWESRRARRDRGPDRLLEGGGPRINAPQQGTRRTAGPGSDS